MLSEQIQSAFRNFLKPILRIRAAASLSSPETSTQKTPLQVPQDLAPQSQSKSEEPLANPDQSSQTSDGDLRSTDVQFHGPPRDPASHTSEVEEGVGILSLFDTLRASQSKLTQSRAKGQYQRIQSASGGQKKLKKGALYDQKAG